MRSQPRQVSFPEPFTHKVLKWANGQVKTVSDIKSLEQNVSLKDNLRQSLFFRVSSHLNFQSTLIKTKAYPREVWHIHIHTHTLTCFVDFSFHFPHLWLHRILFVLPFCCFVSSSVTVQHPHLIFKIVENGWKKRSWMHNVLNRGIEKVQSEEKEGSNAEIQTCSQKWITKE